MASSLAIVFLFFSLVFSSALKASENDCEAILAPVQAERFDQLFEDLRDYLSKDAIRAKGLDRIIDEMTSKDVRGVVFQLEALLRIYDGIYGQPLKELRYEAKKIEDLLGAYSAKLDTVEYAATLKAPMPVQRVLQGDARDARKILKTALRSAPKMFEHLTVAVAEIKWQNQKRDQNEVIEQLEDELRKIEPLDYDLSDLQSGIHELRRNLRWILIYCQALNGLIGLEPGAGRLNEYDYLETHLIAKSKYSRLRSNPRIKKPVLIPAGYFLALSKIVTTLGEIKDAGERYDALAKAYLRSGLSSSNEKARKAVRQLIEEREGRAPLDTSAAAKKSLDELERTQLLKWLRKALRD